MEAKKLFVAVILGSELPVELGYINPSIKGIEMEFYVPIIMGRSVEEGGPIYSRDGPRVDLRPFAKKIISLPVS